MEKDAKIYIAGSSGLVGSAIARALLAEGYSNLVDMRVDLTDPVATEWLFSVFEPEYVFLCAAKVGGIVANRDHGVEFFQDNIRIQTNVIENAYTYRAKKLLFLSSACAYPKHATNPITEDKFLTGELEPTNECYALAKIAGMKLCQAYHRQYGSNFITVVPTNLYGPRDHYDLENSHVLPGMIRRIHEAKQAGTDVTLWGTGNPGREFLFSDDLARACLLLMEKWDSPEPVNVSSDGCVALFQLAKIIAEVIGFTGNIKWDNSKPDGTPWRNLDITKIRELGWYPKISLREGIRIAYDDFLKFGLPPYPKEFLTR